ncbi:glycosyltransferase family 4 protein [Streptomyces daliensis]
MRIAYLHGGSIPSAYAGGVHAMRMCDAFSDAGHDVTLYALPGTATADPYVYYGVRNPFRLRRIALTVEREGGEGGRPGIATGGYVTGDADAGAALRRRAARVRTELERGPRPDLLYGREPYSLLAAAELAPVVYEANALWDDPSWRETERALLRHPSLKRVVFVAHGLARAYAQVFPELAGVATEVAPDGADPAPQHVEAPVELPGRPDALKAGYVGHLHPGRAVDLILALAGRLPAIDVHLVGGTTEGLAYWRGHGAPANVHFHGHRSPAQLAAYYPHFDVVLAPYQSRAAEADGAGDAALWMSPPKLFEYMAHGRAMVVSDLPVLREVLRDGEDCLLCPPEDVDAWTAAVTALTADGELRRRLGASARDELLARYTWRRRADLVLPPAPERARTGS